MKKILKYGLIGYGVMVGIKTAEILINSIRLSKQKAEYVHGVEVLRDTGILRSFDAKIAAAVKFTDGRSSIVVDDLFMNMPAGVQRAILAHEQGHMALGHLDQIDRFNQINRAMASLTGGVQDIELEADEYAAGVVGADQMIFALEYLKGIKRVNRTELNRRIRALQVKKS